MGEWVERETTDLERYLELTGFVEDRLCYVGVREREVFRRIFNFLV